MSMFKTLDGQIYLSIFFITLLFCSFSSTANNYSIYLVRHAEKVSNEKDPQLTRCGISRAKQLASILSETKITQVYSTHYQRTMQTASPLAQQQKIAIKNYNPRYLEQFSLELQQKKTNTLVVGHSNTTPRLVKLLTKQDIAPLSEQEYQQLYQVQYIDEHVVLTILKQPKTCKNKSKEHKKSS